MNSHPPALQTLWGQSVEGLVEMNSFQLLVGELQPRASHEEVMWGQTKERIISKRDWPWDANVSCCHGECSRLPLPGLSLPGTPRLWWEKSTLFKLLHLLWVQNAGSFNESKAKNTAYPRHGDFNPSERWKSTNAEWLRALPVITKE